VSTLHKDARDVLLAPVVSEKSYGLLDQNKYTFLVRKDANKTEIKIAVEQVFSVKVTAVNTVNRVGKRRRTRAGLRRTPRHQARDRERGRRPAHRHLLRLRRMSRRDERY
jgi:large subunit ribosomal protein L23